MADFSTELPRQGPFKLVKGFGPKTVASTVILTAIMLSLGGGSLWYAQTNIQRVTHVASIWDRGEPAVGEIAYQGEVTTTNFVFKSYDLQVEFVTQTGEAQRFEAEFDRFFSGPDDGDPVTARYLTDDPSQAALSWQHEARVHEWIWILIVLAMGVGFTVGGLLITRKGFSTLRTVKELARHGKLVAAEVIDAKVTTSQYGASFAFRLRTPAGGEKEARFAQQGKRTPWLLDEEGTHVVVLASLDESTVHVMSADGYPLELD